MQKMMVVEAGRRASKHKCDNDNVYQTGRRLSRQVGLFQMYYGRPLMVLRDREDDIKGTEKSISGKEECLPKLTSLSLMPFSMP